MLLIKSKSLDPFFNLSAEEYLLKNFDEDVCMLWKSSPSVILGKHQNIHEEVELDYVRKNNMKIARRISGGGTVYHDEDNINFTFIMNGKKGQLVDFHRYTIPIIHALKNIGIDAKFEGKNDLRIDGKKISGNAEHVYKNKVLHHGTLLFKSNLKHLSNALKKKSLEYESRAVQSVRSTVTNIYTHLRKKMETQDFFEYLFDSLAGYFPIMKEYELSPDDIQQIQTLENEKFSTWEWIFGYSPNYTFKKSGKLSNKMVSVEIEASGAIIKTIKLNINGSAHQHLSELFLGARHDPLNLKEVVDTNISAFQKKWSDLDVDALLKLFY